MTKPKGALSKEYMLKVMEKLEMAGLDDKLAKKITDSEDDEFSKTIVKLIVKRNEFKSTESQREARKIMGKNFFGPNDAIRYFNLEPTEEEVKIFSEALAEIPFSRKTLEKCRNTHVLAAMLPISIIEIREKVDADIFDDDRDYIHKGEKEPDVWYHSREFALTRGKVKWILIRKKILPNSKYITWETQRKRVGINEEIPTAQELMYAVTGHYLKTGEKLFKKEFVRTKSIAPRSKGDNDVSVSIKGLDSERISVNRELRSRRFTNLGITVAIKPEKTNLGN